MGLIISMNKSASLYVILFKLNKEKLVRYMKYQMGD